STPSEEAIDGTRTRRSTRAAAGAMRSERRIGACLQAESFAELRVAFRDPIGDVHPVSANVAPTPKAVALVLVPALVLMLAFAFSYVGAFHDPTPHGVS